MAAELKRQFSWDAFVASGVNAGFDPYFGKLI